MDASPEFCNGKGNRNQVEVGVVLSSSMDWNAKMAVPMSHKWHQLKQGFVGQGHTVPLINLQTPIS